ncbi:DUF433 domain-containing protein [Piscinibacter sp.]|uniref:DUF433 domain-containing protein n=1 Tax=Piscinibacter sp. TaxID=1903157 RepID=UPI002C9D5CF4|nr:DUF433 domain-containing protein [Albitalea sp.]HUG23577.1 DUF433 domain-containing protein [Albitalea sp.]
MDWQGRIVTDPDTLFGKPRIAGTRISVDFVLDLLASGWTEAQILDNYPHLKLDDLQAVFAFGSAAGIAVLPLASDHRGRSARTRAALTG